MDDVSIGSDEYRLLFCRQPAADCVDVRIEGPMAHAARSVVLSYVTEGPFLPTFFRELAEAWRGWANQRTWRSPWSDLLLAARHDGVGHVLITATLRNFAARPAAGPTDLNEWSVSVVVLVEPGSLHHVANSLARLLGAPTTE